MLCAGDIQNATADWVQQSSYWKWTIPIKATWLIMCDWPILPADRLAKMTSLDTPA